MKLLSHTLPRDAIRAHTTARGGSVAARGAQTTALGTSVIARGLRAAGACIAALVMVSAAGCGGARSREPVTLRFWAMGREGEVVEELVRDFEREQPGIRVEVQQIPWGAAHEKLLTAHVGNSTPDAGQLGNTWISEFVALRAIEPLADWVRGSASVPESAYFAGIWDTNVIDGIAYGIPWYVDTRLLFYRRDLLARAGYAAMPETWDEWRRAMEAVKALGVGPHAIFLPTNEYTPWIIFGLQAGSPPRFRGPRSPTSIRSSSVAPSPCTSPARGSLENSRGACHPRCSRRGTSHRCQGPTAPGHRSPAARVS